MDRMPFPEEHTMGKRLAAAGMAAAIGVGGLTVAALNPFGTAGAQDGSTTTTQPAGQAPGGRAGRPRVDGPLKRALDKLVADKTLTQAQADAVIAEVKAQATAGMEERRSEREETVQALADAIGITPDELKAGLKDGTSIAAQAQAKGVDRQVLEDLLTTRMTARIDQAVTDGHLTADQAAKAKEHIGQMVDRILDADGSRLRGRGPGMGMGPRGRRGGN
jgi:hypothetical protein